MKASESVFPAEQSHQPSEPRLITTASLRRQAAGHAQRPGSVFTLIERPAGYGQNFEEVYFPPEPDASLEAVDDFCTGIIGPYFAKLRHVLAAEGDLLEDTRRLFAKDGRLLIYTNHGNLVDVAMVMAALQCELADPELIQQSRIFVGPIVKELEIRGHDTIPALQKSSGVFVAFPDTDSTATRIESGDFDAELVDSASRQMLKEFVSQGRRKDIRLLATAPSGSTDDIKDDLVTMKPISPATESISERYFDALVPVAIAMRRDGAGIKIGKLQKLHQGISVHDVMEKQLAPMYEELIGKRVVYQRPERKLRHSAAALGNLAVGS